MHEQFRYIYTQVLIFSKAEYQHLITHTNLFDENLGGYILTPWIECI